MGKHFVGMLACCQLSHLGCLVLYIFPLNQKKEKKMIKFCIYYYSKKIKKDKIRTNYDHEDFKKFLLKPMSDPRGN